jgi:hypothetical protein
MRWLGEFLFVPVEPRRRSQVAFALFLLLLYVGGVVHWVYYFHGGQMTFQAYDWPKEYSYYSTLKQAVTEGRIPYHIDHPFQGTNRFMSIPETVISPQIILLRWLSVGQFILVNFLFLYSLFFAGCVLLMRRFRLPPFAFLVLFTLAGFNGHITAHLAVGHSMWGGFFLLPFFALEMLNLAEGKASLGVVGRTALVLFAMFMQGSFHIVIWCWMFLAFMAAGTWRLARPVVGIVGLSALLSAFRLIPDLFTFAGFSFPYLGGYPSLQDLFAGLTVIRQVNYTHIGGFFGTLGWQEYDAFIGLGGLAFVLIFGIYFRIKKDPAYSGLRFAALDVPIVMMVLLSINDTYAVLARLPLFAVERVSSRFIIIPLVILIVLGSIRFGQWLPGISRSTGAKVLLGAIYIDLATSLAIHNFNWRISRIENNHPKELYDGIYHIITMPDSRYVFLVNLGIAITILTLAVVLLRWIYPRFFVKAKPKLTA